MPRPKPTPKRRRLEEEAKEREALATLKETPSEFVEEAAAEAFRTAVAEWPEVESSGDVPSWLSGLGVATRIPAQHFAAFQALARQSPRAAAQLDQNCCAIFGTRSVLAESTLDACRPKAALKGQACEVRAPTAAPASDQTQ